MSRLTQLTVCSRLAHGLLTASSRSAHVLLTVRLRPAHVSLTVCLRQPKASSRSARGQLKVSSRPAQGMLTFSSRLTHGQITTNKNFFSYQHACSHINTHVHVTVSLSESFVLAGMSDIETNTITVATSLVQFSNML